MQEANRTWLFERLKHALQLLASAPETQLRHFPDCVHVPDEFALDFEVSQAACVGNFTTEMTTKQLSCLDSVDQRFERMIKGCFADDAIVNLREWRGVRLLAADALKAFDWPCDEPSDSGDAFIRVRPNSA